MAEPAPKSPRPKPRPRRPAAKQVVVPYWVEISSDTMPPRAREAFTLATASWDGFRRHVYDIQGVGVDPDLRIARFHPRYRVVYREAPTRVDVIDIVNEATIEGGHVVPYPLSAPRTRRSKTGPTREAV